MWCVDMVRELTSDAAAREEKSITEVSRDIIPAIDFLDALKRKRKKGLLSIEFKALNRLQSDNSCEVALLPENRKKNYYPEVLPFDHCRVILESLPAEEGSASLSDYVNASYIDAYNKPKAYIAAQGPSRHTISDFWKMVWQENVHCIVMATNVFEHARQQCEKYWHNVHGRYGDVEVWLDDNDMLADFNVRTFRAKKDGCEEERVIKQYQFANWSDHDCPNPSSVLEYRRRIKAYTRNKGGPIVVHCGAGAGRTGTFIAIDAMLDRVSIEKTVDIFNYVLYLRNSRQSMVRNLAQYEFIYDTVAMYLQCGVTVITARELPAVVQKLAIKDQHTRLNGFEREFKTLQVVVPKLTVGECAGGHRAENRRKSRDIMLQPPERARPYLITHDSNDSTDYINAVYVDGYRHTNAYIVTQWPLKSTVNDIWRLVYDYNIPTLVLLNDGPCSRGYPRFWPTKEGVEVPYGPLTIELVSIEDERHIVSRVFRVRKPRRYELLMDDFIKYLEKKGDNPAASFHVKYKDLNTHLMEAGEITNLDDSSVCRTLVSLQTMSQATEEAAKTVKLFQLKCWPVGHKVPTSSSALIDLLTKVEDWQMNNCRGRIPTCVLSRNGVSRCGVYCAVSIAWEKLKSEGEVDIFRAVKTIKMNRPELVENLVEYIYCYTFMVILLEILNTTQPNLIPRREVSEEESWDNREKPLSKPERTAKGALYYPLGVSDDDPLHDPGVNVDPDCDPSTPASACVKPSMLLPGKSLSRSSSIVSTSSSHKNFPRKDKYSMPGFRNPAFQNDLDDISKKILKDDSPVELTEISPKSKALPKHILQSPPHGGVFDSKESADSGISKGQLSSTEEARDDSYGSPNSEGSHVNPAELMVGRSAMDATTRRRIYHQESIKNRTNLMSHGEDEVDKPSAGTDDLPIVIVHRASDVSSLASDNSSFVVIDSPERHTTPFVVVQSDGQGSRKSSINSRELDTRDVNYNLKKSVKNDSGAAELKGSYQECQNTNNNNSEDADVEDEQTMSPIMSDHETASSDSSDASSVNSFGRVSEPIPNKLGMIKIEHPDPSDSIDKPVIYLAASPDDEKGPAPLDDEIDELLSESNA